MDRADSRKYHFIYKTTCLITGSWYIGMHSSNNLDDGYLGSGKRLWYSIKKHGKENHSREIVEFCSDRKSLSVREKEIINKEMLKESQCMNLKVGGEGGDGWKIINDNPILKAKIQFKRSSAGGKNSGISHKGSEIAFTTAQKMQTTIKARLASGDLLEWYGESFKGHKHTTETREKMSVSHKGKQTGEKNSQYGTCWITNGNKPTKINKEDLDEYLLNGYRRGRK